MTFEEIVEDYIDTQRPFTREEMQHFEEEDSLQAAIRRAALCKTHEDKRHQHQRRIRRGLLEEVESKLQTIRRKLAAAKDFALLHDLIAGEIKDMDGIGALTVYDIAHRIGAYLRKAPKLVYLHRGTKEGAAILGFKGQMLDPALLPKAFKKLTPAEIEDCLCVYKAELRGGAARIGRKAGCITPARQPCRC